MIYNIYRYILRIESSLSSQIERSGVLILMISVLLICVSGCGNQSDVESTERSTEKYEITIQRHRGKIYLDDDFCNNLVSQLNDRTIKKGEDLELSTLLNSYMTDYSTSVDFRHRFNDILEDKNNTSNTIHAYYDVTFQVSYTEDEITITYYKVNHARAIAP